jgi:hypothetical protein
MSVVIDGTTGVSGVSGSASTPALQGEDTNTGVFFPAADTVAVATGGTERMRVASTGFVGIGTTSPSEELHIYSTDNPIVLLEAGPGTDSRLRLLTANNRIGYIEFGDTDDIDTGEIRYEHSSNAMIFATNGNVDRVQIGSAGEIGIGGANYGTSGHLLTSGGSGAAPSWASVGTAIAGLAYGDVGTYAYLNWTASGSSLTEGQTIAGSSLNPAGAYSASLSADVGATSGALRGSATLSGTWRSMGRAAITSAGGASKQTVFLRIS